MMSELILYQWHMQSWMLCLNKKFSVLKSQHESLKTNTHFAKTIHPRKLSFIVLLATHTSVQNVYLITHHNAIMWKAALQVFFEWLSDLKSSNKKCSLQKIDLSRSQQNFLNSMRSESKQSLRKKRNEFSKVSNKSLNVFMIKKKNSLKWCENNRKRSLLQSETNERRKRSWHL